jgi:hypothetical protein
MACKRSGVRIPVAPQFFVSVFDETVTILGHWKLSVLSLISVFMGARMRDPWMWISACDCAESPVVRAGFIVPR